MTVYVCTEVDRWDDNEQPELKEVFDSEKKAKAWVSVGEYKSLGGFMMNNRKYSKMEVK